MIYKGLLLLFVLEYLRLGMFVPGLDAARLNTIVPLLVILGALVVKSSVRSGEVLAEPNTKILGGLLIMILASFLVANITMMAFEVFTTVLGYVILYWLIATHVTDLRRIKGLFTTLIFVHLVLCFLNPAMFTDPSTRHYIRGGTFLGDGNDFALSVILVIPFCLFLMFEASNRIYKLTAVTALILLVLAVVATQSRGGTLALAIVAFYYWLKSHRKVVTGSLSVVVVIVVLLFAPPRYFERMNSISSHSDGSAQGRITAWRAGMGMAWSNPLLGVGAGNFPAKYTQFAPIGPDGPERRWKTAHSIYFLVLGELGLPGLALLVAFIAVNLRENRRLQQELRSASSSSSTESQLLASLSASVLAYATAGAFLSAAYYPHMFVLAGLSFQARRQIRAGLRAPREGLIRRPAMSGVTLHWALRGPLTGGGAR